MDIPAAFEAIRGKADTVVCVATGPSLTQADVDYCRGKVTTIVVNDAHHLAPWADCLYSSDRYWWAYYKGVPSFTGMKATIEFSPGRHATHLTRYVPDMLFFRNTGDEGIETDPTGLRTCRLNSGGAALNLAVHCGAPRIVLLGYDMGVTQAKPHFFGEHPVGLSRQHNFPSWRQGFETMRAPLEALGISVVNCTRTTSLAAFPCAPLEDTL